MLSNSVFTLESYFKENAFLKKYFKDFGPTKFKILIKEKELA